MWASITEGARVPTNVVISRIQSNLRFGRLCAKALDSSDYDRAVAVSDTERFIMFFRIVKYQRVFIIEL
ncbi:hypothetical protein AWB94_10170 [Mycolicibacterium canariasense]|nr:hypothetical protein AWB94_10170 [Mycolicibacterium canariasense]